MRPKKAGGKQPTKLIIRSNGSTVSLELKPNGTILNARDALQELRALSQRTRIKYHPIPHIDIGRDVSDYERNIRVEPSSVSQFQDDDDFSFPDPFQDDW
jgi:hypothetical protein